MLWGDKTTFGNVAGLVSQACVFAHKTTAQMFSILPLLITQGLTTFYLHFSLSTKGEHTMRTKFSRTVLAVGIALALVFTFSCSSGGDNGDGGGTSSSGGGSSSPSGGGIPFDENSQIYDYDYSDKPYTGNGIIGYFPDDISFNESLNLEFEVGSVTDGIVNLRLPSTVPDKLLEVYPAATCTESPSGLKYFILEPILTDENYFYIGDLYIYYLNSSKGDHQQSQQIEYWYFSKAGKITCNDERRKIITNINATVGWNKIYTFKDKTDGGEISSNNILTKKMYWSIHIP